MSLRSLLTFLLIASLSVGIAFSKTKKELPPIEYVDNVNPIVNLTNTNIDDYILTKEYGPWFVMFYAPWCGHCKKSAPTWVELSKTLFGKVNIGMVDCVANPYLQRRFAIRGYPTFLYFKDGKVYTYKNARTIEDWSKFALETYQEAESEDIPLQADSFREFGKEVENTWGQVKYLFKEKPLVLAALVGGFIVMVVFSFWCTAKLTDKMTGGQEEAPAVQGAEANQNASNEDSTEKSKGNEGSKKLKED